MSNHGSQNPADIVPAREYRVQHILSNPRIICWDQEPVLDVVPCNLNIYTPLSLNRRSILLHSCFGLQVERFLTCHEPAFYWTHGLLAHDWYRYARYDTKVHGSREPKHLFLIYNRAWTGTREYRLKFTEMLKTTGMLNHCKTWFGPSDPVQGHYSLHRYHNPVFRVNIELEHGLACSSATGNASASYEWHDYNDCHWEIVLETVFDFASVFLTEKILRPIAMGIPFVCVAPAGSLKFLKRYGFQTFDSLIDESYDDIIDPMERFHSIFRTMTQIKDLDVEQQARAVAIAKHNQSVFFNGKFYQALLDELHLNVCGALANL